MKNKKILVYLVSFLSLSFVLSAGYYYSYTKALQDFNKTANKRDNDLIMSLEDKGLIIVQEDSLDKFLENNSNSSNINDSNDNFVNKEDNHNSNNNFPNEAVEVDANDETLVLPSTKYILQTYNIDTDELTDETLQVPSYLVGLNRDEVIEYLDSYMEDLPWNEFRDGLSAYELLLFSDKEIIIKKTYNPELVQYQFFIKAVDDIIVVFYSDQKTVYQYTNMSVRDLPDEDKSRLEEGYFIEDHEKLYAILENYTS